MSAHSTHGRGLDCLMEEVTIMGDAFWAREMAIIQLKQVGQEKLTSITEIKKCLLDVKFQDKLQRELEQRVITKYFQIKADLQFQRLLTLRILEQLLINQKKAIQKYEEHQLIGEIQFLRRDTDQLKREISEVLQESKHNLSQTLTFLARFSRNRLDAHIQLVESSLVRQIKKQEPPPPEPTKTHSPIPLIPNPTPNNPNNTQLRIFGKTRLKSQFANPLQENIKSTSSDTKFDIIEIEQQQNPYPFKKTNSIFTYYQNMFKKHHSKTQQPPPNETPQFKAITFKLIQTNETDRLHQPQLETTQLSMKGPQSYHRQVRPQSQINPKPNDAMRMSQNHPQSINQQITFPTSIPNQSCYSRYDHYVDRNLRDQQVLQIQQPSSDIEPNCLEYYANAKKEMRNLPDSEQRSYLLRCYKDSLRCNSGILFGVDLFRRSYQTFLQRNQTSLRVSSQDNYVSSKRKSEQIGNTKIKEMWNKVYISLRERKTNQSRSMIATLDYKEISQMYNIAFPGKKTASTNNNMNNNNTLNTTSKSPVAKQKELRIKTDYQLSIIRPTTSIAMSRTETSEISSINTQPQTSMKGTSVFTSKMKKQVQPLPFKKYDYFNL